VTGGELVCPMEKRRGRVSAGRRQLANWGRGANYYQKKKKKRRVISVSSGRGGSTQSNLDALLNYSERKGFMKHPFGGGRKKEKGGVGMKFSQRSNYSRSCFGGTLKLFPNP